MTSFERNAAVKSGYYFNPTAMTITLVERDGGRLPSERGPYFAVPALAALALSPILGALFLMTLPLLGYALTVEAAGRSVAALFSGSAGELAVAVAPGYVTGEFHLSGHPVRREAKVEVDPLDLRLAELEREIARRRGLAA
jgi:hypothetical protein